MFNTIIFFKCKTRQFKATETNKLLILIDRNNVIFCYLLSEI